LTEVNGEALEKSLQPLERRSRKWLRAAVVGVAVAYPVALLVVVLLLVFVGETWWPTDLCLYLPRWLFALPLPFTVAGLLAYRARRLLATQLLAFVLLVFPLMGFVLPWPVGRHAGQPVLRVLSYNVNSGYGGFDKILAEIDRFSPDVVLIQELFAGNEQIGELLTSRYPTVQVSTQFLVASRHPILSNLDPEKLPHEGRLRSPRFVQYIIETPLGRIAFYNVHPVSPRPAMYRVRGKGLRREILSGRLFAGENVAALESDSALRGEQVEAFARFADQERDPVVIAGDTNLPGLSVFLSRHLSRYRDGFRKASWGFGYTFPADKSPWMRIDKILASDELRFVGFEVGRSLASDHLCVVADLERASQ
jgi:endonuclease/exonuclease/phosphatase (EEP) superfamily protein YafD